MPTGPVDDKGSEVYFLDNGPVEGSSDYTTLILYHGGAFNANIFQKILPLTARHNIRLVLVARRGYSGSSEFSASEIADLHAGKKEFLQLVGQNTAYFLAWFAAKYDIPQASGDRRSGGLVVMGWSIGNVTLLAMLGNTDVIPKETRQRLEPYLRKMVIFDPPHFAYGYTQPPEFNPFTDVDPADIKSAFSAWAATYYSHPDLPSHSISGLNTERQGNNSSMERLAAEGKVGDILEGDVAILVDFPLCVIMQPAMRAQTESALFDEQLARTVFPGLPIVHMWCAKSLYACPYAAFESERLYEERVKEGRKVRPMHFVEMPEANHLVQWDDPDSFWAYTVDAVFG